MRGVLFHRVALTYLQYKIYKFFVYTIPLFYFPPTRKDLIQ